MYFSDDVKVLTIHHEEGLLRGQDAGTADRLDLLLSHAGEEPEKAQEAQELSTGGTGAQYRRLRS
jgi:hypothetical protein